MDARELRALQTPLKERYRAEPAAALVTLRARGKLGDAGVSCRVETGRALVEAGLHPATGGGRRAAGSGGPPPPGPVGCARGYPEARATPPPLPPARGPVPPAR